MELERGEAKHLELNDSRNNAKDSQDNNTNTYSSNYQKHFEITIKEIGKYHSTTINLTKIVKAQT